MDYRTATRSLPQLLQRPLPGLPVQRQMAPAGRIPSNYDPDPPDARASAVLIIITPELELVFIRRAQDGRAHGGQIAFPGGVREEHDPDLLTTSLRETEEEIGVHRQSVTVLGALTPLYIPVTNFSVQPFVATVETTPAFVRQPDEVDEVLLLPLAEFGSSVTQMEFEREGTVYQAPTYRFGSIEVWGATAMITAELLYVLAAGDGGPHPAREGLDE